MKRTLGRGMASVLYRSGAFRAMSRIASRVPGRGRSVQILMYHRVTDTPGPYLPAMPVSTFRAQMESLVNGFRPVSLDAAVEGLGNGELPRGAVAVTFDDGYRDNFTDAFPVLRDLGIPATIFLATGAIGTGAVLWHDRVFRAFAITHKTKVMAPGPGETTLAWSDPRSRDEARDSALRKLKAMAPDDRDAAIAALEANLESGEVPAGDPLMLDWTDVEHMRDHGIRFGAHTVSHPILARLDRRVAAREIAASADTIATRLGERPRHFAYPNGSRADFAEDTKDILRENGFRSAVTTVFGTNHHGPGDTGTDVMELKRSGVSTAEPGWFTATLLRHRMMR